VRSTSRGGDAPARHLPLTHIGSLPHLHRLDIDLPESVVFHDADIAHLAKVCPSLEILRLCPLARFPQTVGAPSLTLDGLTPLTRGCHRLHTLAVVVNAVDGSEETLASRAASSRSLLRLQVGHSWIQDPLQTAIMLSHLAPYLENLKWFHEKNRAGVVEANALSWQKVSEYLPHLQSIRLLERRQQPQPQILVPPPSTEEKGVDATVLTVDQGMLARPQLVDNEIQVQVQVADISVQISPQTESISVDATPVLIDTGIMVIPTVSDQGVEAYPQAEEKAVGLEFSEKTDAPASTTEDSNKSQANNHSMLSYLPSPATGLISLTFRVVRFYSFPFRYMYSLMPAFTSSAGSPAHIEQEPKSPVPGELTDENGVEKYENGAASDLPQRMDVSPVGL